MAYCTHCGSLITADAKFCPKCGVATKQEHESSSNRKIVYDGEIHKCPNCGEILNAFSTKCPSCGYEVRGANTSATVQNFTAKIGNATTEEQKVGIIRSYPVPNNKEDILDFMILASSNIGADRNKEVYDAWVAKFEQAYQKSSLLYAEDDDFSKFKQVYDETLKKISKIKLARGAKTAGVAVTKSGRYLFSFGRFALKNAGLIVGIILFLWSIAIDKAGGDSSLHELIGVVLLITSACILDKRDAMLSEFFLTGLAGALSIWLAQFLKNGSIFQLGGGLVLIIVGVNFFRSLIKKR